MFDTVIVATDGSRSATRAVEVAFDLAGRFGATVHALYVVESDDITAEAAETRLQRVLTETADTQRVREASGRDVRSAVREGDPATEIQAHAREHDADLVATGTRGRHGEHRFVLGSVAEALVRDCPAPVLTVRQLDAIEA